MNAALFRECFKCKFKGDTTDIKCPNCGRKLYGPKEIRTRGIVQLIAGLFLVVFMGGVAIFVSTILANGLKDPTSATKIQQQSSMFLVIFAIFGLVIVFGLHGL